MSGRLLLCLGVALAACRNDPERPILPVEGEAKAETFDVTLRELKRLLTPRDTAAPINWSQVIYLNPVVLLPPGDSAPPLMHDPDWLAGVVAGGLVQGICGKPPTKPCPAAFPIAFTSLGVPWTRGGDTTFLRAGYVGEVPGQKTYDGVFWLFTVVRSDEGQLRVTDKGPANNVIFESDK